MLVIESGDVIVRRAENGWVVWVQQDDGGAAQDDGARIGDCVRVFEDSQTVNAAASGGCDFEAAESLANALRDAFDSYTQQKRRGGLRIDVRARGYDADQDAALAVCPCAECRVQRGEAAR